ncbi:MAG: MnhB domain-containing protein [Trueperaceae bacterium]
MNRFPDIFFRTLSMPIVFVLIAIGLHFFLRGHNAPGGGFVAGLIIAVAALLVRMSGNRRLLTVRPMRFIPVGLVLAIATGIVPMLAGNGFLTSAYGYRTWPLIGEFEWATAVLFDAGVFLVVVGATLTIIDLLAEDSGPERVGLDRAPELVAEERELEEEAAADGSEDGPVDGPTEGRVE